MRKKYIQACEVGGSIYGKKRRTGKKGNYNRKNVNKKELIKVYNKFYKDQVAALYRAIHHGR